jgi:cytochrome b561
MLKNSAANYGIITKLLHWLIALCIAAQILLGFFMDDIANKALRGQAYFIHKSLGLTLLFLAVLFVLWRCFNRKPAWPAHMPQWERFAARTVHFLLYATILVMPLSGWLMSSAAGYPPSFWGWFTVAAPIETSKALSHFFNQIHSVTAWTLSGLIGIHVVAALKHFFIDKDGVLQKML